MIIVIVMAPTIKNLQNKPDLNIINFPFKFISFNTSGLHPAVSVICEYFPEIPILGSCTCVCWISSSVLNVNSWIFDEAAVQSWDLYRRILQQDSSLTAQNGVPVAFLTGCTMFQLGHCRFSSSNYHLISESETWKLSQWEIVCESFLTAVMETHPSLPGVVLCHFLFLK